MRRIPDRQPSSLLVVLVLLASAACGGQRPPATTPAAGAAESAVPADDGLNATLWVQTAAEYRGAALQAYRQAEVMLDAALADRSWSAGPEQLADGGFADLPPAVILDVDETVLDNSAYQARLILDGTEYATESWNDWVRERKAVPVPGALEFTRFAAERGVAVFYVTNRRHVVEEATRANLASYGFPLSADEDRLLTRDERPDWGSDKATRRRHVGSRYRILLLVGDNLGDFAADVDVSVAERERIATARREFWGERWIMLPNPQYGSWEGALFGFEFGRSLEERRRIKRGLLRDERD